VQNPSAYGGSLQTTRKGRAGGRPLCTARSIHLTLRSTQARGARSFRQPHHADKVRSLIKRFSGKFKVRVFSVANVGNHLHLHVQLANLKAYTRFIRALTAAIAMAIMGTGKGKPAQAKFWDRRPFTRLVNGVREFIRVKDYIEINNLEGDGIARKTARWIVSWRTRGRSLNA